MKRESEATEAASQAVNAAPREPPPGMTQRLAAEYEELARQLASR
jgi:hypothetical protein